VRIESLGWHGIRAPELLAGQGHADEALEVLRRDTWNGDRRAARQRAEAARQTGEQIRQVPLRAPVRLNVLASSYSRG
jgi:hypothetical protein